MVGKVYKPESVSHFDLRWFGGDRWTGPTPTDKLMSGSKYKYGERFPIQKLPEVMLEVGCLGKLSATLGQNGDNLLTLYITLD